MDKEPIRVEYRSKNINVADISGQLGKLPPQAVDLEEAILAAIMLEKDAIHEVVDVLQPGHFYKDAHQEIYSAVLKLYSSREPIDILTVTDQLKKEGKLEMVGGAYYVTEVTTKINSSANIVSHTKIVIEKSIKRELIKLAAMSQTEAYEDTVDAFDVINNIESTLFKITEVISTTQYKDAVTCMTETLQDYEAILEKDLGDITGVPSGFKTLDSFTAGWQNGDLIIIAGRPSMGKTAFVITMMRNIVIDYKLPVAIFSIEMPMVQITKRLIGVEADFKGIDLKKARIEPSEILEKTNKLSLAKWFIDDPSKMSLIELRSKARRLKYKEGIGLIIIDYLQLMEDKDGSKRNREQEISAISRGLKGLAKELNIPVIALSQLTRAVEARSDKRPQLSDLRESGSIEQDADFVMFMYRPEYYGVLEDKDGNSLKGKGEMIIAKHRNGALGPFLMDFHADTMKWSDIPKEEKEIDPGDGQKEIKDDEQLPF